ncbi:MAG: hypothetical protein IJM56_07330, partial [Clostridia bacterium]|nr:hypothetical protein [Clostridia bacterium]
WLENDTPRRALPLPEPGDAFGAFLKSISSGAAHSLAKDALESTRVALMAREAADKKCTMLVR